MEGMEGMEAWEVVFWEASSEADLIDLDLGVTPECVGA